MTTYTILDHTADTGIEATADSLAGLIRSLATGMFDLMGATESGPGRGSVTVEVSATSEEDLAVDSLSELLFRSEVEGLALFDFTVEQTGPESMRISASGIPWDHVEITGPSIKAVTYHDLEVTRAGSVWLGRVYFDV